MVPYLAAVALQAVSSERCVCCVRERQRPEAHWKDKVDLMHRENHSKELLSLRLPAFCAEKFWSVSMSAGAEGRGGGEGNAAGTLSKCFAAESV